MRDDSFDARFYPPDSPSGPAGAVSVMESSVARTVQTGAGVAAARAPKFPNRLCPECKAWLCRGDDAWCGNCGYPCAQIELLLTPSVLHIGQRPPKLRVEIVNASCAELGPGSLEKPDWVSAAAVPLPAIPPGGRLIFFVEAHAEAMTVPSAGIIGYHAPAGQVSTTLMAIEEEPKLTATPSRVEAWTGSAARKNVAELTVAPQFGELRLRRARLAGIDGAASLGAPSAAAAPGGLIARKNSGIQVALSLDGGSTVTDRNATLIIDYDSPHGQASVSLPLQVAVRRPPQLWWVGADMAPEVRHPMGRQTLAFEFHNQDPNGRDGGGQNAELVFRSIELTSPSLDQVRIHPLFDLPVHVAGGAPFQAEYELDLSSLEGQAIRSIQLQLKVVTNLPELQTPVNVNIEPIPQFQGVVAIDFGSSNSCCAVWRQGEEPRLVPLDTGQSVVTPTVVRYLSLAAEPPQIETGRRVRKAAVEDREVAASIADRLKQRLGDKRQEIDLRPPDARAWTTRKASEAAADYLTSVREWAEAHESASFRDFILTHPARCSLRQFERLRGALEKAFGSGGNKVTFMEEPIAALIEGIALRAAAAAQPQDYTVASFDLGGGTTDVAVIAVKYAPLAGEQLEMRTQILYSRGVRFGGEDLTDYLAAKIAQRCQQQLHERGADVMLVAENMRAAAALDAYRNRMALRAAAEAFKASVSQEKGESPGRLSLRVMTADGQTATYNFDFDTIEQIGGRPLREEFLEHTRREVEARASLLRKAVDERGIRLDIIQLSGKTSYLNVVREVIAESFPGVVIEQSPDPKECVVKGACLSRSMRRGRITLRLPEGTRRMTSTIGIFAPTSLYFQPILRVDEPVPNEFLERELPNLWDGVEPVELWEDMDDASEPIEFASAAKHLQRFGVWMPETGPTLQPGQYLPLRITLRGFKLEVSSTGPNGQPISFHPMEGSGE